MRRLAIYLAHAKRLKHARAAERCIARSLQFAALAQNHRTERDRYWLIELLEIAKTRSTPRPQTEGQTNELQA